MILLKNLTGENKHPPLNSLPKLQPAFASQYRYFWLELALANEGKHHLNGIVNFSEADELLKSSYRAYLQLLVTERIRLRLTDSDIRRLSPTEQKTKAALMARNEIIDEQSQAQKHWFKISINEARSKVESILGSSTTINPNVSDDNLLEVDLIENGHEGDNNDDDDI